MKLFKISQDKNKDYDTYDSAIVCAENEDEARKIHPYHGSDWNGKMRISESGLNLDDWCNAEDVKVEYVGEASDKIEKNSVLISSFNAG